MTIAWLIEKADDNGGTTGLCLGCLERGKSGSLSLEWTSPLFAMRFCRKEDAEKAAAAINPGFPTVAVEHSWEDFSRPDSTKLLADLDGLACKIVVVAQLKPNEGILDAAERVKQVILKEVTK